MKILLVDDNKIFTMKMKMLLKNCVQSEIISARDGYEALKEYNDCINSGDKFDMIFLDINIPYMNGLEVLDEMRKIEEERNISRETIYILTATPTEDLVMSAFIRKADAFIIKNETLNSRVTKEVKACSADERVQ